MQRHHPAALPAQMPLLGHLGWLRGAAGAGMGILLAGPITRLALNGGGDLPWLLAPMGASAVLLFMLPASPLAQPWPVIGGNVISATIGIGLHRLGLPLPLAAALAVFCAIAAMSLLRCLHPPAGGTALVMALATPPIAAQGWHMLALPLLPNVLMLVLCALVWNRATGHSYPHRAAPRRSQPCCRRRAIRPKTSTACWRAGTRFWTSTAMISTRCSARLNAGCRRVRRADAA